MKRGGTGLVVSGPASFVLLAGLFGRSVTGVLATVAVSLSAVVTDGSYPLSDEGRWLLCGAVAAYFVLGVGTGVALGYQR